MKVALICQPWEHMAHPNLGSVEIQIDGASRSLVKAGVDQVAVYTRRDWHFPHFECRDGVKYRRFGILHEHRLLTPFQSRLYPSNNRPIFASSAYYASFFLQVAGALLFRGAEIIHVFNFSQFLPLARRLNPRAKIVIHMQCEWLTQLDPALVSPRLCAADAIVGCSEFVTKRIRRRFPQHAAKCTTIYNGVDLAHFQVRSEQKPRGHRLLYVGRISREKGIHFLLDTFSAVLDRVPDASLDLVGSETYQGRQMIEDLDEDPQVRALTSLGESGYLATLKRNLPAPVAARVRFLGPVPHNRLPELYHQADVFVFPSVWHEPFGVPVVEAQSAGLPMISTRSGGIPELIRDGITGVLLDRADSHQLADALTRILTDNEARSQMGPSGRRHVAKLFSWDAVSKSYVRLSGWLTQTVKTQFAVRWKSLDRRELS